MPETMGSAEFCMSEIWGCTPEQIKNMRDQRMNEAAFNKAIEDGEFGGPGGGDAAGGGGDLFGGGGDDLGTNGAETDVGGGDEELPPEENAGEEPEEDSEPGVDLLTSADGFDDDDFQFPVNEKDDAPVKPKSQLEKSLYNRGRRRTHGASKTHMPDFVKMTGVDNESMKDPTDSNWMKSVISNPLGETHYRGGELRLSPDMLSTLKRMRDALGMSVGNTGVMTESTDVDLYEDQEEIDIDYENDVVITDDQDDDYVD